MNSGTLKGPAPNEQVLSGVSLGPPSLSGYPFLGTIAAWSGSGGSIYVASDQSSPPYSPEVVNPSWTTFDTPAISLAVEWENSYLAWTDADGAVRLASTADGWKGNILISGPGSASFGPALLFGDDRLYAAWRSKDGCLSLATCDRNNNVQILPTSIPIVSRPTLAWAPGQLYALSGGTVDVQGGIQACLSQDQGKSFAAVDIEVNPTIGPPAMAIIEGKFYLVWADGTTSRLRYTVTDRLDQYVGTNYSDGCHNGGPAIVGMPEGITLGWSYGAPPEDPRAHHITLAQEPVVGPMPRPHEETFEKLARVGRPNPCPDPLTVYNPSTDKCVPRGGCVGRCVLQSFTVLPVFPLPVFNPIRYAICIINCE